MNEKTRKILKKLPLLITHNMLRQPFVDFCMQASQHHQYGEVKIGCNYVPKSPKWRQSIKV